MANHKSAEKRARQITKITERNRVVRSRVKTATKKALAADEKTQKEALSEAFSKIQKSKKVYHPNTVSRKMSRLAKALAKKSA